MKVSVNNSEAVPIIITHRTVSKAPTISVSRKFLGLREGFKNLLIKAIDLVQESFWKEEQTTTDPGESKVVHYAIDIADDGMDADRTEVIATKLHGSDRPGCGAHFEVVKILDDTKPKSEDVIRFSSSEDDYERLGRAKEVGTRPKNPRSNIAPPLPGPRRRLGIQLGPTDNELIDDGDVT